ncbi:hypothetical protein AAC387_Pa06g0447 [Persea americana]
MVVAAKSATNSSKTPQEDLSHRNYGQWRLSPSSSSKKAQTQRNLLQIRVRLLLFFFFILHKTPISRHLQFWSRAQAFRPEILAICRAKPSEDASRPSPHHATVGLEGNQCYCCNAGGVQSPLDFLQEPVGFFPGGVVLVAHKKIKAPPSPAPVNSSNARRVTPERRRSRTPVRGKVDSGGGDQLENSKPAEQRWPGRIRQANPLTRSLDYTGEKLKAGGMPGSAVRGLQQSVIDNGRRVSMDGRILADLGHGDVGWKALQSKA